MLIPLVVLTCSVVQPSFVERWETTPDRVWLGSDWWANRLQDWHVQDGAVWCTETRPNMAMRTAQLLTRTIDSDSGDVVIEVDITPPAVWPDGAKVGVLIGGGGPEIDYRLTAQTHHVPAEDGGLLVVVEQNGSVQARSFEQPMKKGGYWSIQTPVHNVDVPLLRNGVLATHGRRPLEDADGTIHLRLEMTAGDLQITATSANRESTWRSMADLPVSMRQGSVALVSHGAEFGFDNVAIGGSGVEAHDDRAWGPVLCVLYTVDDGVLNLTAQFPPMNAESPGAAQLEINRGAEWVAVDQAAIDSDAWTASFRVEKWDHTREASYRVVFEEPRLGEPVRTISRTGRITAEPTDGSVVIAAMNCQKVYTGDLKWNHDGLWLPHVETVSGIRSHDPDLLFFAGDQIYEGDLTPVDGRNIKLDYLYKWFRWCWAFGELTRDTPTVVIPDDHDVYHGNIWGSGGKRAVKTDEFTAQDSGGYRYPPDFVNMVHRTQTSHLPAPVDPMPIEQGISVYFTDLNWGGVSCAILDDRMFKSSPSVAVPAGKFRNGWPQAEGFDPATESDVPGAELLGPRQEAFLEAWSVADDDRWASVVLGQTPFCNLATLPEGATSGGVLKSLPFPEVGEYPQGYHFAADGDSNGWPQTPRDRAVRSMAKSHAIHICGDQHLGAVVEYGVDTFDDGAWGFSVPAIANGWPRRWYPPTPGENARPGLPYTGEFFDGFGNRIRVHAVANPVKSGRHPANLHDRMPGYGIIRLERDAGTATLECWRRPQLGVDESPSQFPGWPVVVPLAD